MTNVPAGQQSSDGSTNSSPKKHSVMDKERPGRLVEIDEDKVIMDLEQIVQEERWIISDFMKK